MTASRVLSVVIALGASAACSLGWEVRPDPGDAAAPPTEAGIEAGAEAGDASARDAGVDAASDADAGPDCVALQASVQAAADRARDCQLGAAGQCTTTVKNECDCAVIVRFANDAKTTEYTNAITAFGASGCTPSCVGGCPQLGPMASWACLQPGSPSPHCVP